MATLAEILGVIDRFILSAPTESQKKALINVLKGQGIGVTSLPPEIVNAARELSVLNSALAKQIIGNLKISLEPSFTKHGADYARNPYDLCHLLSLLWIRAHIIQPSLSAAAMPVRSHSAEFFAATTAQFMPQISASLNHEQRNKIVSDLFERLIGNGFLESGEWVHRSENQTCENFIGTPVAGIHTIPLKYIAFMIHTIVSNMLPNDVKQIVIFIHSHALHHAMAMMISLKDFYATVRFYDPNSPNGDAKIHFNVTDSVEKYAQKILALMNFAQFVHNVESTDLTLICLNASPHGNFQLSPYFYCFSGLESQCLITLASDGDNGAYLDSIQKLVRIPNINLNARTRDGATPLIMASRYGHVNIVNILVHMPTIDLTAATPHKITALIVASQLGHDNVVAILAPKCDVKTLNERASNGATSLILAARQGHDKVVRILVLTPGIELNGQAGNGMTALMMASQYGHSKVVEILISIPQTNMNIHVGGWSALSVAIESKRQDIVTLLLRRADLNIMGMDEELAKQNQINLNRP